MTDDNRSIITVTKRNHPQPRRYNVQAVIIDRTLCTKRDANKWVFNHNFIPIKPMHETQHYYRYRIKQPNKQSNYFTMDFIDGIKFIIEDNTATIYNHGKTI